jgi:hypothetical protein
VRFKGVGPITASCMQGQFRVSNFTINNNLPLFAIDKHFPLEV